MADEIIYKKVTDLTEKTEPSDTDLVMVGHEGAGDFRKITWKNISNSLKAKLQTWLFDGLITTDKTLVGAVNEVNNKLTPKVYSYFGEILKSFSTGTTIGHGRLTVFIEPSGIVRIEFMAKITTQGTVTNVYDIGLPLSIIQNIDANIPTLRPLCSGLVEMFDSNGILSESNGYAGCIHPRSDNTGFTIGRFYTTDGNVGMWSDSSFEVGEIYKGVAYAIIA